MPLRLTSKNLLSQALVRIATSLNISSAEDAAELRIVVFSVGNMAQWLPCAKVGNAMRNP